MTQGAVACANGAIAGDPHTLSHCRLAATYAAAANGAAGGCAAVTAFARCQAGRPVTPRDQRAEERGNRRTNVKEAMHCVA